MRFRRIPVYIQVRRHTMAMMVKTYVLLCVVGLCTTLFVILIMYGDNHKPVHSQPQLRNKPINNSTRQLTLDQDNFPLFTPNFSQEHGNKDKNGLNSKQFEPPGSVAESNFKGKTAAIQSSSQRMPKENNSKDVIVTEEDHSRSRYFTHVDVAKLDPSKLNGAPAAQQQAFIDAKQNVPPPQPHLQMDNGNQGNVNQTLPDKQQMINEFKQYQNNIENKNTETALNTEKNTPEDKTNLLQQPAQQALPDTGRTIKTETAQVDNLKTCKPQNDIALLKTHKCSSSTLQNILYRWGDEHDLSFVLPKGNMPYLGNPALFNIKYAIKADDGVYNILANHARFEAKGLAAVLPADTTYITILRNPATQYESLYNYYRMMGRFGVTLEQFLTNPSGYFSREPQSNHIVGRNSMLFDLGLDARYLDGTNHKVTNYIQMLDKKFKLVLIAEHFAESLILLKDLLCWTMDDIVFLNQNARSGSSITKVTTSMQQNIFKWNSADALLYKHFNQTLWRKIETYGRERMKQEVAELKARNEALSKDCVASTLKSGDPRMWYPPGVKMESFKVNPNAKDKVLCERITRPELTYMKLLADKQRTRNTHGQLGA